MKTKINILIILCSAIVLWSCENELKRTLEFDIKASTEAGTLSGTSFAIDSGTQVTFDFTGDPDFITFYSGAAGHEYAKRNLFEIPINKITSKLKFRVEPQYGIIEETLKVYLSTEFEGLRGNDKQADSVTIINNNWIDVTEQCNLPIKSKQKVDVEIPLDKYLGKKVSIGFLYNPKVNTSTQPTWIISELHIENTEKATNYVSTILAKNMGFKAFDMFASNPYNYKGGSGIWNLSKIAKQIRIQSTASDEPLNKDWLTSNPILINSRDGDKGVLIKKMSIEKDSYKYTFNKKGTYEVTFLARNVNYEVESEAVRKFVIEVK